MYTEITCKFTSVHVAFHNKSVSRLPLSLVTDLWGLQVFITSSMFGCHPQTELCLNLVHSGHWHTYTFMQACKSVFAVHITCHGVCFSALNPLYLGSCCQIRAPCLLMGAILQGCSA